MTSLTASVRTTRFERGLIAVAARIERLALTGAARRAARAARVYIAADERAAQRRADAIAAAHTGILPR